MPAGESGVARGSLMLIRALGLAVLLVVALAFTPVPNEIAAALRPAGPVGAADAIVVLGAGVNAEGGLTPSSLLRLVRGLTLYREGRAPVIVLSGSPHESDTRTELALRLGVPAGALRLAVGLTTREEAFAVRALLPSAGARIILVTTSTHLQRAAALFARAGFTVDPAPVDYVADSDRKPEVRLTLMRALGQELVARLYYLLAGYL